MTLKQLEYFIELSKDCHFSNVSKRQFISQSSLSYSMAELEKDLGVKLFDHQGRRVILTEEGRQYAKMVGPILDALEEANRKMRAKNDIEAADIHIGYAQSMYAAKGPDMVRRFYENPHARGINLILGDLKGSQALKEDVLGGKLDLIFSSIHDEKLERVFLFHRPMMLYVPRNHRFATRTSVTVEEILDESFVSTPAKYPSRQIVDSIFLRYGWKRKIAYEQPTNKSTLNYVAAGLGVAIIPYSPEYLNNDVTAVSLANKEFMIDYYLQWEKDKKLSPAVEFVRSFIINDCKDLWEELSSEYD